MREIKFRAWDGENMRPVEMLVTYETPLHGISVEEDDEPALGEVFFVDKVTSEFYPTDVQVMQFTGLKDKNGKEIYEGDVVRCTDKRDGESVLEVRYLPPHASFRYVDKTCTGREYISELQMFDNGEEVIGNIYENPELLNQNSV